VEDEETKRGQQIVVTSIPTTCPMANLVETSPRSFWARKLPMRWTCGDESTDDVRVVLELKPGSDPALVVAYLYKHTPLELSFHVNMTCLGRRRTARIGPGPAAQTCKAILSEFFNFREDVVTVASEFELAELRRRIHILEGLRFSSMRGRTIRIIPQVRGKAERRPKRRNRFTLDRSRPTRSWK